MLRDEFEGKTAADVEQVVMRLEEEFRAAAVELIGEPTAEPTAGEPQPEQAVEAGSELEEANATIAELRERLAAALELAGQAAEGVPPV